MNAHPGLPQPEDPQEIALKRMQAMVETFARKFDISEPNALGLLVSAAAGIIMVYDQKTGAALLNKLAVVVRKGALATDEDVAATNDAVGAFVLACAPTIGEA